MVRIPMRSGKERDTSGSEEFRPEPHELELLEPFLSAKHSVYSDVSDTVSGDSRIPDERKESLLKFYRDLRSKKITEGNSGSQ